MPTITQRIALDGGEEIRRQFKAMGDAGKAALELIDKSGLVTAQTLDKIVRSVARVERSFIGLSKAANEFGSSLSRTGAAFGSFEGAILRSVRNIGLLTAAVGGAAAGFVALVKNAADAADNIGEQAAGLGLTTDRLQEFGAAATDSGIDAETFGRGLGNLAKVAKEEAEKTLKEAAKHVLSLGQTFPRTAAGAAAFAERVGSLAVRLERFNIKTGQSETIIGRLGVATLDASGKMRGIDDVFLDIADAVAKLPPGIEKTTTVMELFGARLGRRFVDMLDKGSEGIKKLGEQFAALKFTPKEITIGDDFAKQFGILDLVATRARQKLALLFGPGLTDLMGAFTETLLSNFGRVHSGLKAVVEQGVKPIIEDLIRVLRGEPVQTQWVADLGNKFVRLGEIIGQAVGIIGAAFQALRSAAAGIAGVVNRIFGTNVSGDALLLAAAVLKITGVLGLMVTGLGLATAALAVFYRAAVVVVGGIRLLLAGLGAFTAITNPFVTIIAALVLLGAAFILAGEDGRKAFIELFVGLGEIAKQGIVQLGVLLEAGLREMFNIKPDQSLIAGIVQALISALAAEIRKGVPTFLELGKFIVDNMSIGMKAGRGLGGGIIGALLGTAPQEAAAAGKEIGATLGDNASNTFAGRFAPVETFIDRIKRVLEGLGFKFDTGTAEQDIAAVDVKASTLTQTLKNLGITSDSLGPKFRAAGQAGVLAFNSLKEAAEAAARSIKGVNADAASSTADLADQQAKLERERDRLNSKRRQVGITPEERARLEELEFEIASVRRKRREAEDKRKQQIRDIAEAEQKNIDAIKRQNNELRLQERIRDAAAAAADTKAAGPIGAPKPAAALKPTTDAANESLRALGQAANEAAVGLQTLTQLDFSSIATAVENLNGAIGRLTDGLVSLDFSGMATAFSNVTTAAQQAAEALKKIQAEGGGDTTELATGGMIRGPGTSTSDSILARLSRGEYVVRAAAVRKYGTGLLSALNGMRLRRPTGFNMGGLVENMSRTLSAAMIPGFAAGGLADFAAPAARGRPIALTINAGGERQTFRVWADEQVADSVVRYATKRQVASAGRKSGAFG